MAEAELILSNGTRVRIKGTQEEVANLLEKFSEKTSRKKYPRSQQKRDSKRKTTRKEGTMGLVKELLKEDYFKGHKRSLPEIQKKLEERGHIYAQTSISPTLTRLTKSRKLRRIKEKKGWMYTV